MSRILVTYASRHGSMAEVAEAIADVLRGAGARVEVQPVRRVDDVTPYDGVVIGSACRVGHILPDAVELVEKHRQALGKVPVALFDVGMTMQHDTAENRVVAEGYLQVLNDLVKPVRIGTFAGRFEPKRLNPFLRFFLSRVRPEIPEGDFRDWEAIRAWARELVPLLVHRQEPSQGTPSAYASREPLHELPGRARKGAVT